MKPIRTLKRVWARSSFARVLPIAAFVCGFVMATVFTVYYLTHSRGVYVEQTEAFNARIAASIAQDVAYRNTSNIHIRLMAIAPQGAIVKDVSRQPLGRVEGKTVPEDATETPILHNGNIVGWLKMRPAYDYQPPLSLWLASLLVFVVSATAAVFIHGFARLVGRYLQSVGTLIDSYTLDANTTIEPESVMFSEFRNLRVTAIRTTKRLSREIETLKMRAKIDARTGLPNEQALMEELDRQISNADYDRPAVMILLDTGNTGSGHSISTDPNETLYKLVSKRLSEAVHTAQLNRNIELGRWTLTILSNEKYAVIATDFGARDDVASIIRELQTAMRAPFMLGERSITLTLQGSIVLIPEDADSSAEARQRAQAALSDMQDSGKTGFTFYSPRLERQRTAILKLESELRAAVEADRFIPLFQPKVDLKTGLICGAEALARWQLEGGRLVSPSVFIDLAEETGLINQIGEQIMRKACLDAVQWTQEGHRIDLAVNVSPRQFEREGLARMILDCIAKSGLSPRQLEIEITESLAIQQPERVKAVLNPLRKMGIRLAIDDFGTGHSNLSTLTQLDFDVFKIDRQFVSGTPDDKQANAIVEMILSMAQTLEMQIVGEGIETPEQAAFLKAKGCHIGQGFKYSPPIRAEAFLQLLRKQPFVQQRRRA